MRFRLLVGGFGLLLGTPFLLEPDLQLGSRILAAIGWPKDRHPRLGEHEFHSCQHGFTSLRHDASSGLAVAVQSG